MEYLLSPRGQWTPAETAFEATLNEQKHIFGMPKLANVRRAFITGYDTALASPTKDLPFEHLKVVDSDTLESVMASQRRLVEQGLVCLSERLSGESIHACVECLHEFTGVNILDQHMQVFMALHPVLAADIYTNSIEDSRVQESFLNTMCMFLCGCGWQDDPILHKLMQQQVGEIQWFYADRYLRTIR